MSEDNKITSIQINFPCGVELPEGFEQALVESVGAVCKAWEKQNPTMVMWPAGIGAKPIWDEPNEPTFDDSVLQIDVTAREDYHGNNEFNPDRERLRSEARKG